MSNTNREKATKPMTNASHKAELLVKKISNREVRRENNILLEEIRCPMCGRKKAVIKQEDHLYFCTHCQMQFDDRED